MESEERNRGEREASEPVLSVCPTLSSIRRQIPTPDSSCSENTADSDLSTTPPRAITSPQDPVTQRQVSQCVDEMMQLTLEGTTQRPVTQRNELTSQKRAVTDAREPRPGLAAQHAANEPDLITETRQHPGDPGSLREPGTRQNRRPTFSFWLPKDRRGLRPPRMRALEENDRLKLQHALNSENRSESVREQDTGQGGSDRVREQVGSMRLREQDGTEDVSVHQRQQDRHKDSPRRVREHDGDQSIPVCEIDLNSVQGDSVVCDERRAGSDVRTDGRQTSGITERCLPPFRLDMDRRGLRPPRVRDFHRHLPAEVVNETRDDEGEERLNDDVSGVAEKTRPTSDHQRPFVFEDRRGLKPSRLRAVERTGPVNGTKRACDNERNTPASTASDDTPTDGQTRDAPTRRCHLPFLFHKDRRGLRPPRIRAFGEDQRGSVRGEARENDTDENLTAGSSAPATLAGRSVPAGRDTAESGVAERSAAARSVVERTAESTAERRILADKNTRADASAPADATASEDRRETTWSGRRPFSQWVKDRRGLRPPRPRGLEDAPAVRMNTPTEGSRRRRDGENTGSADGNTVPGTSAPADKGLAANGSAPDRSTPATLVGSSVTPAGRSGSAAPTGSDAPATACDTVSSAADGLTSIVGATGEDEKEVTEQIVVQEEPADMALDV